LQLVQNSWQHTPISQMYKKNIQILTKIYKNIFIEHYAVNFVLNSNDSYLIDITQQIYMQIQIEEISDKLKKHGLKITPQRVSTLEAIYLLNNHSTAQQIIDKVHNSHPNIAIGTIYKTLDTLVKKGVITKVSSEDETIRYDWQTKNHHHIYDVENKQIEDYMNSELDSILKTFFNKNKIPNYNIESIQVHIKGKYNGED